MNVVNNADYYNSILKAIIVNSDYDEDPEGKYRYQIYIPSIHFEYNNIYQDYMLSDNKSNTGHAEKFPWAISLVEGLENGNVVYVSNIDNNSSSYIILGAQANTDVNYSRSVASVTGGASALSFSVSSIVDLCMPIIIHNEVGISTADWPDNISQDRYTKINAYDNGGWSIGLLQWHHTRAYDILKYITTQDPNWRDYWSDKSLDLYIDLDKGSTNARLKYQENFHPTEGTALYSAIQGMLGSEKGKIAQRLYASSDVGVAVSILQNNENDIENVAIIIYLADIMNQYGNNLPSTIKNASTISHNGNSYMIQLNQFVDYCKNNLGNFNTYITRRNTTYQYITNLNLESAPQSALLVNISSEQGDVVTEATEQGCILGNGQYAAPLKGSYQITATFGYGGYHTRNGGAAYYARGKVVVEGEGNGKHSGLDFGCPSGTPVYAADNGTVIKSGNGGDYGTIVAIKTSDGNGVLYAHLSRRSVSVGQDVVKGQVIGHSGNTGNSGGPHLHFEIDPACQFIGNRSTTVVNPLPFIGLHNDKDYYYDRYVQFV